LNTISPPNSQEFKLLEPYSETITETIIPDLKTSETWKCKFCEALNFTSALNCNVCLANKPIPKPLQPVTAIDLSVKQTLNRAQKIINEIEEKVHYKSFTHQNDWSCISCGQINSVDRDQCEICTTKRPGSTEIKKRKDLSYGSEDRTPKKLRANPAPWQCTVCGTENIFSICSNPNCLRIRSGLL